MLTGRQAALASIAGATRELPDSVIEMVATTLEAMAEGPLTADRIEAMVQGIAGPAHRQQLKALFRGLAQSGQVLSPSALAWALRGAAAQDAGYRASEQIHLVWTGPPTPALIPRRSDGALIEVIDRSKRELYVATFAAYRVTAVKVALERAVARGVSVRLILETPAVAGGKVAFDPLPALAPEWDPRIEVYTWPQEHRATDELGRRGSLHMKCAVADAELALVSSANLTELAFDLNMELGVLIRSRGVAGQLQGHLESLIIQGILRKR